MVDLSTKKIEELYQRAIMELTKKTVNKNVEML